MAVLKDCLKTIKEGALRSATFARKLASGSSPGSRATPARSSRNDAQVGGRLDWGEKFTRNGQEYQSVNFQLNKNANDSGIKRLVQKNGSHTKYAEAVVPISAPVVATEKVVKGKKVPIDKTEIETAKKAVLNKRAAVLFQDLENKMRKD